MFGKSSHVWIEGEGMLHALYFVKDRRTAAWNISYKNKHVQTDTFKLEKVRKKPGFLPAIEGDSLAVVLAYLLNMLRFGEVNKYLSNTNVFEHSNKYYSIAENHLPQEIDIFSLETLRNWNLNGSWNRPFTSHPKVVVIALRACKSAIPGPDFGLEKFEWFSNGFQHTKDHIDENCDEFSKDDKSFLCRVCEWRLNMHTGEVKQRILTGTDFSMEFPMINHNFVGVYIVDAKKFSSEAVAVISLPSRVPYGFHGAFMSLDC
nr:carotenoid 9,10(9',10')-cleavage dioxygenase 1-like [Ipomoea batatas]